MRCHWLICEPHDRWHLAVRHFGPRTLPQADDSLSLRCYTRPSDCQSAIADHEPAVVIWQLPGNQAMAVLQAIDWVNRGKRPILQFAALDPMATCSFARRNDLELGLREIGVFAVLSDPLSFVRQESAIRRFWLRHRRIDNRSLVQQIWDRLPWSDAR